MRVQTSPNYTPTFQLLLSPVCRADLVFVVDHSGSISDADVEGQPSNWQIIKDFLASVVDLLVISPDETRVGMVTFGTTATLEFDLDDYSNKSQTDDAIEAVPYRS